jgi:predicted PurR-regulated permease PerM
MPGRAAQNLQPWRSMAATNAVRVTPSEASCPPVQTEEQAPVAPPNGHSAQAAALYGLLVLAIFAVLYSFGVFFLPLFMAVLFNLLLSPAVRALKRIGIPEPAGAVIILLGALGLVGFGAYQLVDPARQWMAEAPEKISKAREKLGAVIKPVEAVRKTAEQVQKATDTGGERPRQQTVNVEVSQGSGVAGRLFGTTQAFLIGLFEMLVLLYFLLAAGSLFTQKIVKLLPRLRDKKKAVEIAREVEGSVSRYLVTIAGINIVEGIAVTLAMWGLGMPNPPLWGAAAALLIFIPYVGALVMAVVLFVVGTSTFDSLGRALAPVAAFYLIDIIQANFLSPHVLGNRMTLNPVAVFVSILLWGHIWGVAGVLIAVPLAVVVKIFCDHVESLNPIGEFLGK